MSNVSNKVFSHTHYGVSTVAAVLYAIAWILGNQVRAEPGVASPVLSAVVVTASRAIASVSTLEPVVVTGYRSQDQTRYAMLAPVIVRAAREVSDVDRTKSQPALLNTNLPVVNAASAKRPSHDKGLIAKVSHWMLSARLK